MHPPHIAVEGSSDRDGLAVFRCPYGTSHGVKLPLSVSNQQYAALLHAIFSVVNVAGLAEVSSVVSDEAVTDAVLNAEYDRLSIHYPWSA